MELQELEKIPLILKAVSITTLSVFNLLSSFLIERRFICSVKVNDVLLPSKKPH